MKTSRGDRKLHRWKPHKLNQRKKERRVFRARFATIRRRLEMTVNSERFNFDRLHFERIGVCPRVYLYYTYTYALYLVYTTYTYCIRPAARINNRIIDLTDL